MIVIILGGKYPYFPCGNVTDLLKIESQICQTGNIKIITIYRR